MTGAVGRGLLALVCGEPGDTPAVIGKLARKTARLRIFEDEAGRMNRSVVDVGGDVLCVSQFTLAADTMSGNRPSFSRAAPPEEPCRLHCVCDGAQGRGAVLPHRRIRRAHARLARQ